MFFLGSMFRAVPYSFNKVDRWPLLVPNSWDRKLPSYYNSATQHKGLYNEEIQLTFHGIFKWGSFIKPCVANVYNWPLLGF
jgi:hypothetical protein